MMKSDELHSSVKYHGQIGRATFVYVKYITFIIQKVIIVNSSVPLFSRSVDYVIDNQSSLEQLHALHQYTDYGSYG